MAMPKGKRTTVVARRLNQSELAAIPATEWARLAAFIDGEGCIRCHPVKAHPKSLQFVVTISNTDPRLMAWLKATFSGYVGTPSANRKHPNHRLVFQWWAFNPHAAKLLTHCLPYMLIKREQAELFLALRKTLCWRGPLGITREAAESRKSLFEQFNALKRKQTERSVSAEPQKSELVM